jgi:glycine reductase
MHPENPGVLDLRRDVPIVPTGATVADMPAVLGRMARLALKLAAGEEIGPAATDGYLPRGIRRVAIMEKPGAERAIEMVIAKATGQPFQTELPIELPERVEPAPPVTDLRHARIALITTGGLVPRGNPDRLVRGNATTWHRYSLAGLDALDAQDWECVHRGFYTAIVGQNPNYILPLDRVRERERRAVFGELYPWFFSTSGVGTAVGDSKRMGAEMAAELKEAGVRAVVLVAT